MSPVDQVTLVQQLWDRQQIRECLDRYPRAIDRLDREMLLSVYHEDAIDDHGTFFGGPEEFADYVIPMHRSRHLSHQHCLFNHTCDLNGDVAHTETYFMFVCMNREGPITSMNGGRYLDRLEKRDGVWKIAYRLCVRDWGMIDERPDPDDLTAFNARRASLPPALRDFMNAGPPPRRDESDPTYARPLIPLPGRAEAWLEVLKAR
jgi:hypothetical protein